MMNETKIQDLDELKLYLKNLLIEDTDEALTELGKIVNGKKANEVILFKSQSKILKKDIESNIISDERRRIIKSKLVIALTSFIEDLKERNLKDGAISDFEIKPRNTEKDTPTISIPTETIENAQPLVALLIFAEDTKDPLGNLKEEEKEIQKALLHFKKAGGNIEVITLSSVDELFDYFTLYKGQIGLIHYGGHASGNGLHIDGTLANATGLANLMGQEPNLQFVFLNGCATAGQVKLLQENRVKTVLATAVPINDAKASNFATRFYQNLTYFGGSNTLKNAYEHAKAYIETTETSPVNIQTRGFVTDDELLETFNWALYALPNFESSLNWKLPKIGVDKTKKVETIETETPTEQPKNNNEPLSDIERQGLEEQKAKLEKRIGQYKERIDSGSLSLDQEFAAQDRVEELEAELAEVKTKLG
jgi:anti-sigma28 factor (negative regulator of flagellin synthesis)